MKKQPKRILGCLLTAAMLAALATACSSEISPAATPGAAPSETVPAVEQTTRTVTDAAGNVVEVPSDLSRIAVTPLPWSSVIYAIDGTSEHMSCINPGAMKAYTGHFFEKLDSGYGALDTTCIGSDFSINMEEMVKRDIQAVVIWDYQTDEAEQLRQLGIPPVMVKNETIEDLQASFRAIGQMLGKEERAEEFNRLYTEAYELLNAYAGQVEAADKPKVLYLRNTELKVQGNDMFIAEALELAGADNVAADLSSLTMEEILAIDPDIILLSNFDTFVPEDLYENRIDGQDWSTVSAVINHKVYKTPMGIYRWDAPGVETPLMMYWLAQVIQPEIFSDFDIRTSTSDYFQSLFGDTLAEDDLAQIFADDANALSEAY